MFPLQIIAMTHNTFATVRQCRILAVGRNYMADILTPVVDEAKFNVLFRGLIKNPGYDPAFHLLQEVTKDFEDIDGNLAEQFQTTGFHQRLWEILLHQFFKENKFTIRREGDNPDFFIEKNKMEIAVEAVTSNPTDKDEETEKLIKQAFDFRNPEQQKTAQRHIIDQTTIKLGSALYSKLTKKYWEKKHIAGKPLVFAIEAFHHSHANNFPDYKIISYLYGFVIKQDKDIQGNTINRNEFIKEYTFNGKTIPFGFFNLEEAKNVSAVIFTNTGNLDKFNRMGRQDGYGNENVVLCRVGTYFTPEETKYFEYYVGSGKHTETWSEGFSVFHNPNAILPISKEIFEPNRQLWLTDKGFDGHMPEFFPFTSVTGGLIIE